MDDLPLIFDRPVVLVGGGVLDRAMLDEALAYGGALIAADGGAARLASLGHVPDAVIGDMDSIGDVARLEADGVRIIEIAEQDTTDFEKCLYATEAPLYLGVGFTGGRVDHALAVLHAMLARPEQRVALLGPEDAIALAPARRTMRLPVGRGARVSVFPLAPVRGRSEGLEWPLDGLDLRPGQRIGTSNRAVADEISLNFETAGALIILERPALGALVAALRPE